MVRYLGVDAGEARVGLATGDDETRLAVPLCIIERKGRSLDRVADEIAALTRREAVERVIVGLPLNIDGSVGPQATRAQSLGRRIAAAAALPLSYWDERMSSFIAEQRLIEGAAAARRRGRHADDIAAAVILQSYFDATPLNELQFGDSVDGGATHGAEEGE